MPVFRKPTETVVCLLRYVSSFKKKQKKQRNLVLLGFNGFYSWFDEIETRPRQSGHTRLKTRKTQNAVSPLEYSDLVLVVRNSSRDSAGNVVQSVRRLIEVVSGNARGTFEFNDLKNDAYRKNTRNMVDQGASSARLNLASATRAIVLSSS